MLHRDPILWSRTPTRRSTCRSTTFIRSARCFSKSSPTSAQHNDERDKHGDEKPDGMSDLERMRQRHLQRWRKRIEADPYSALFGASEDMLRGRGLGRYFEKQREMHRKGLEWVEKTFPKWMLEDMGLRGQDKEAKKENGEDVYPKKVKIDPAEEVGAKEPESIFRQPLHRSPSYRSRRFEKDFWNDGVESPSDPRRPREPPVNALNKPATLHEDIIQGLRKDRHTPEEPVPQEHTPAKTPEADISPSPKEAPKLEPESEGKVQPNKDATARETSFIEEFLANKTQAASPASSSQSSSKDWRQTSLERRAALDFAMKMRRQTNVPVVDVAAKYKSLTENDPKIGHDPQPAVRSKRASLESGTGKTVIDFHGLPNSRLGRKEVEHFESSVAETCDDAKARGALANVAETPESAEDPSMSRFSPYPRICTDDWVLPSRKDADKKLEGFTNTKLDISSIRDLKFGQTDPDTLSNPPGSTSDVLKQLPEDDLDFLTADDVRASMGRTKGNNAKKAAARQKLDEEFNKDTPEIDPMLEAKIMNDQYVRRRASELTRTQEQTKASENERNTIMPGKKTEDVPSKAISALETSLDFMSRWLHNGGNEFAQHFWQDPVPLVAGQLARADEQFLKGIGIGVLKGHRAFASIKDELVEDIPASKELVDRLSRDEIRASAGAVRLYRELPSALKDTLDADASKAAAHKRIGQLRQALLDTDREYKKACEAVDGTGRASKPPFLQEKHLRYASEVLRKNAKLTRMAVFGLQGRIEVEAGTSGGLVAREVLHRLLALQDTQLALSKLVLRSMQMLGINPNAQEEVSMKTEESKAVLSDPSVVEALASVAANDSSKKQGVDTVIVNQKLEVEINKQKAAMRGLSDDGYKHPPKPFVRKPFDGPNPLAHSLFRPFGLQLASLGKDTDAEKDGVVKAAKKAKGDKELIKEVRKAYEDTYGAITVDHWQVPPTVRPPPIVEELTEVPEKETPKRQPSIQMLKEDEISLSITGEGSTIAMNSAFIPEENVSTMGDAAEVETAVEKAAFNKLAVVEDLRSSSTSDKGIVRQETSSPDPARAESNVPAADLKDTHDTLASSTADSNKYSYVASTDSYVPLVYKTLIYNAETDKLSITTSQVPQPNSPIATVPLYEALATLSHPAKFVDHLPESFHVIAVKPDVLSVRTASPFNATAEKKTTTTLDQPNAEQKADTDEAEGWKGINPVDGTTTLSPTGFVGVRSDLDREVDFAERRRKADEYHREVNRLRNSTKEPEKKERRRVGMGGVVKTAIWAGAFCYIVGVAAEVAKAPF
ncbi:uncharacterized protein N0V89_000667 [Didymosphaeria variabile]|uniref:Uncharacterized protein n=1 Tax=Didymosphaeria variabile TaxID=1932322 RepID=A0A9W9CFY5_9PLEO|nr:uncharacterized protein N0V89_000667 [Didymosphaeria variabile]KAJ4360107.1 hypothetical protein N0V89_000667 [Didymosphaeria variabile]